VKNRCGANKKTSSPRACLGSLRGNMHPDNKLPRRRAAGYRTLVRLLSAYGWLASWRIEFLTAWTWKKLIKNHVNPVNVLNMLTKILAEGKVIAARHCPKEAEVQTYEPTNRNGI